MSYVLQCLFARPAQVCLERALNRHLSASDLQAALLALSYLLLALSQLLLSKL